jgi:hypothetical protein
VFSSDDGRPGHGRRDGFTACWHSGHTRFKIL